MYKLASLLVVIGGLNWLLVGVFGSGLGAGWLDHGIWRIVFILVGPATVYMLFTYKNACKKCMSGKGGSSNMPPTPPPAAPMS